MATFWHIIIIERPNKCCYSMLPDYCNIHYNIIVPSPTTERVICGNRKANNNIHKFRILN